MTGTVEDGAIWDIADRIRAVRGTENAFGEFVAPPARDGVMQMPYVATTPVVDDFGRLAYDGGLVEAFDWGSWWQTERGRALCEDPGAMADADETEVKQVITAHIRADRFVEGALLDAFESGLVLRALDRLREIRTAAPKPA